MTVEQELGALVASTRGLYGAAACSVALASADGASLTFVAADGAGAEHIVGVSIPVSTGIAGWVALSGQPTGVADVDRDDRFARDVAESTSYVPTAILAAPMVAAGGDTVGVVEVLDPTRLELDLGVLAVVASQAEAVLRLGRQLDAAEVADDSDDGGRAALLEQARSLAPDQVALARALLTALGEHR